jgi:hypothetical protein
MPGEKSVKRGRGRPRGVKDRKPRRFRSRLVVPLEQVVLSKREAAAVAGVGLSKIDQNLAAIGAVRSGARVLIFRDRLLAWVQSLPPAMPFTRQRAMTVAKGEPVAVVEVSKLIKAGVPGSAANSADRGRLGTEQAAGGCSGDANARVHDGINTTTPVEDRDPEIAS